MWEDRFGEASYLPLVEAAVTQALKTAGVAQEDLAATVVAGLHERSRKVVAKSLGAGDSAISRTVGNPGTAQAGLLLVEALDTLTAGQHVLLVNLADGVDAFVFRATEALEQSRTWTPLTQAVTQGTRPVP